MIIYNSHPVKRKHKSFIKKDLFKCKAWELLLWAIEWILFVKSQQIMLVGGQMTSNGTKPQVFNSAFTVIKLTLICLPKYRLNAVGNRSTHRLLYTVKNLMKKQYISKH